MTLFFDLSRTLKKCEFISKNLETLNNRLEVQIYSPAEEKENLTLNHDQLLSNDFSTSSRIFRIFPEFYKIIASYLTYDEILQAKLVSHEWKHRFEALPKSGLIGLPLEIQLLIIRQLNLVDFQKAKQVCSRWNFVFRNPSVHCEFIRFKDPLLYQRCNTNLKKNSSKKVIQEKIFLQEMMAKLLDENQRLDALKRSEILRVKFAQKKDQENLIKWFAVASQIAWISLVLIFGESKVDYLKKQMALGKTLQEALDDFIHDCEEYI